MNSKKFIVVDNKTGNIECVNSESEAAEMVAKLHKRYPQDNPDEDECFRNVYEVHDSKCKTNCYCSNY